MDFFESKCFQYGVNHCKTTFISCLCLSREGWDTKLSRLVCSVQIQRPRCTHLRLGQDILMQVAFILIGMAVIRNDWMETCSLTRALSTVLLLLTLSFIIIKKRNIKKSWQELNLKLKVLWMFQPPPTFFSSVHPDHVWRMAATDLHASVMLHASVGRKEGGRKGVIFTVHAGSTHPWRCFCIKKKGGDERCQCPLSVWPSSSFNSSKRQKQQGEERGNNGAIFCRTVWF